MIAHKIDICAYTTYLARITKRPFGVQTWRDALKNTAFRQLKKWWGGVPRV